MAISFFTKVLKNLSSLRTVKDFLKTLKITNILNLKVLEKGKPLLPWKVGGWIVTRKIVIFKGG